MTRSAVYPQRFSTFRGRRARCGSLAVLWLLLPLAGWCADGMVCRAQPPTEAADLLVQKVCVAPSGQVRSIDPCACAGADRLRPLAIGERTPYHKVDQLGVQRHDAFPAHARDGLPIVISPFDFNPFDTFNLWGDGYDMFVMRDGWASIAETRDGGGFSSTFFTTGCLPYNGWVLFPTDVLGGSSVRSGRTIQPISGRYWEHNGEPWPGQCPTHYANAELTTWDWITGFEFGGSHTGTRKVADTLRVVHGLRTAPDFDVNGHVEVFYFTVPYGITRWESWVSAQAGQAPEQQSGCNGDGRIRYEGRNFVRKACRDWTAVQIPDAPESVPYWPVPARNLLANFHFAENVNGWNRTVGSGTAVTPNWAVRHSALATDMRYRQAPGPGLAYLAVNCADACSDPQMIYQDVPVPAAASTGGEYAFGATLRSEAGNANVRLRLLQLDAQGNVVATNETVMAVSERNERQSGADSVALSAGFYYSTAPAHPAARTLRYALMPVTAQTVDIVDAWLLLDRQ